MNSTTICCLFFNVTCIYVALLGRKPLSPTHSITHHILRWL